MQFFTITKSGKSEQNKPFFQKKIAYHNENNTIKPSSSMLLHHHFVSITDTTELEQLLDALALLHHCNPKYKLNRQNTPITVDYHLRKNTPNSQGFNLKYLTDKGFPKEIDNFKLNSVGVNVEKALFSNLPGENKHIQIVYSSKDNKMFQCIKKTGTISKNNSYNEFIFNLHIAKSDPTALDQLGLEAQLENIGFQALNISNDQIFQDLLAMELPPQYQTVQDFYNIVFAKGSYPNGYHFKGRYYKGKFQPEYHLKLDKVNGTVVPLSDIKHLSIGQEMLAPLPPATVTPIVANNPVLPPAIPDNQVNNSAEDSDTTKLAAILDDILQISKDTDSNTDVVSSGENSEDALDPLT